MTVGFARQPRIVTKNVGSYKSDIYGLKTKITCIRTYYSEWANENKLRDQKEYTFFIQTVYERFLANLKNVGIMFFFNPNVLAPKKCQITQMFFLMGILIVESGIIQTRIM